MVLQEEPLDALPTGGDKLWWNDAHSWCRNGWVKCLVKLLRIIIVNEMLLRTGACLDKTRGRKQLFSTDDWWFYRWFQSTFFWIFFYLQIWIACMFCANARMVCMPSNMACVRLETAVLRGCTLLRWTENLGEVCATSARGGRCRCPRWSPKSDSSNHIAQGWLVEGACIRTWLHDQQ